MALAATVGSSSSSSSSAGFHSGLGDSLGATESSSANSEASGSSSAPASASKRFLQGKTLLSQADFALRVVGNAPSRTSLVDRAKLAIDKSSPLVTSRSGGKKHPKARQKEASINFLMMRIREMIDNGEGEVLKPLMDAKGQDVAAAAATLYQKMRQLMNSPSTRAPSTIRSRMDEWLEFQSESGTMVDRRIAEGRTPPKLQAGDADVYELATMLGWIDIKPDLSVTINDTSTGFKAAIPSIAARFAGHGSDDKDSIAAISREGPMGRAMAHIRGGPALSTASSTAATPDAAGAAVPASATSSSSRSTSGSRRARLVSPLSVPVMQTSAYHDSESDDASGGGDGSRSSAAVVPKAPSRSSKASASRAVVAPGFVAAGRRKRPAEEAGSGAAAIAALGEMAHLTRSAAIQDACLRVVFGATSGEAEPAKVEHAAEFARRTVESFVDAMTAGHVTSVMEEFTLGAIERLIEARCP